MNNQSLTREEQAMKSCQANKPILQLKSGKGVASALSVAVKDRDRKLIMVGGIRALVLNGNITWVVRISCAVEHVFAALQMQHVCNTGNEFL